MFGIYLLYLVRRMKSPFAMEATLLAVFGLGLSLSTSVPSVIANMSESQNSVRYLVMALSSTGILVKALVFLSGTTLIYSLRNFGTILKLSHLSSVGRATLS